MDQTSDVVASLRRHKVITIYRGFQPAECRDLTRTLHAAGLRLFEVTMNSPRPFDAIRLLRDEFGSDVVIGAGTVLDPAEVDRAADAGARFIIAPDINDQVVARAKQAGLAAIPGAFTATEVLKAVRAGADLVKVFPISAVGAGYIRQLRGPLDDIGFVATGGVDADLARQCFAQGCVGVGVGAHLLGARPGGSQDTEEITRQAKLLVAAAQE